jgi:hypothetical protein
VLHRTFFKRILLFFEALSEISTTVCRFGQPATQRANLQTGDLSKKAV